MKSSSLFTLCALVLLVFVSSCKQEGCTDREALNFNVAADEDDNSCVYCSDSQKNELGRAINVVTDERWGTEYFGEPILDIDILQHDKIFTYTDCGQSGCFFDVRITNIIDKDISLLQFFVTIPNTNGFSYSYNQWEMMSLASGADTLITNVLIAQAPQQYWPINDQNLLFGNINSANFN